MLFTWLIEAFAARNPLDADAVSYLDISYSCLAGNWHALVNGYWSPAYPFLLAGWMKLFHVGPFRESLAIHLFAVASLALALFGFELCLAAFFSFRRSSETGNDADRAPLLSDDAIRLGGYALFFWISTFLTPPYLEQPDILVFALYLLISAFCMRTFPAGGKLSTYVLLGVLLGIAYLVKAVMFPLGFVFLIALLFRKEWTMALPGVALALVVFAAVSAPYIFELSQSKGRWTYGDAGAVNYRQVMDVDGSSGNPAVTRGAPAVTPHAMDFTPILHLGTYPPWSDPSSGYKGGRLRFNLGRQVNRIHIVLKYYFDLYFIQLGPLTAGFLVLLFYASDLRGFARRFASYGVLWFPASAGLAIYALIRAEGRMLAGFTMGLFLAGCAAWSDECSAEKQKVGQSVILAVALLLFVDAAFNVGHEAVKLFDRTKATDSKVALALQEWGVQPGGRVSYLGYALTDHGWAHVARVRIVTEIPAEDVASFWSADRKEQGEVLRWLAATQAKAVVTRDPPPEASSLGWKTIAGTDYSVLMLPTEEH
jgi:hypothetical protein